jgi:hypothetical protein
MEKTREKTVEERRRLKAEYGELFDEISALLFHHDPIGINFERNTGEYEAEVGTILPRLRHCQSADDVSKTVYEEFVRWFDRTTAGPPERYRGIALEIWQLLQRNRNTSST